MNVIICLDQNNGMLFNNRRQSRDRIVRKNILEYINVDNNLENATEHDFCFVERQEVRIEEINKLIVYRWDKIYPADKYFNMDDIKCNLVETLEFQGYSHEKIIREIYQLI